MNRQMVKSVAGITGNLFLLVFMFPIVLVLFLGFITFVLAHCGDGEEGALGKDSEISDSGEDTEATAKGEN